MSAVIQNSSTVSETLKARKANLSTLLKLVDTQTGKYTETQKLTVTAIKAEMGLIEERLKNRR